MPEKVIKEIKKNLLPQWKVCFWAAIIIGLITHFYKLTNWLPNWDSLVFRYDPQNMVSMGRWFLPVASGFSSFYDLPWLTGLLSVVFHALGAVSITEILGIKKKVPAFLVGALVASFPTVASVLMYNYVADAYALSFLFAVLAALMLIKQKPNYISAVVLIALSVGIYQAYITVTIMLLLCHLIIETLHSETKIAPLFSKVGKFLLAGVVGMVIYYLILTVILKITRIELLDYQGFGDAANLAGLNILGSLYTIKETFFNYFFDFSKGINAFSVINIAVFCITAVFYVIFIIKQKIKIQRILIAAVLVALLPVGATILSFVNCDIDYHNLMKMGFVAFYLPLVLIYEKIEFEAVKPEAIKSWAVIIVSAALIFDYMVIANVSYHKLNIAYEKSISVLNRIVDRIDHTEGSDECEKILVLGALEGSEAYSSNLPPDMTGTTDGYILRADDEIVGQSVLCSALNDYCGRDYKFLAGEAKKELLKNVDEESIESWPAKNSIQVVDNVIVIKLGD